MRKPSKKNFYFIVAAINILFLTSCATICGGLKYNAHILVNGRPQAEIIHEGIVRGNGSASILVKRKNANKFSLTIREQGCDEQTFNYQSRTFRGWALAGTVITFTTNTLIPIGLGVDLVTGALWKPNVSEEGVLKHNFKNFQYVINYTGCKISPKELPAPAEPVDVVYLKNGSVIRGKLIETDLKTQAKIQTRDGSIFVLKLEEIDKIAQE